jgi:hypothetical protein
MSFSIVGGAGIDDCSAGEGSCGANCGTGCHSNSYQIAYPYFPECGNIVCEQNSGQPKASETCGSALSLHNGCTNKTASATLQDCGPGANQLADSGYCFETGPMYLVGCVNTALFSYLCNGCNPLTYGILGVRYSG